MTSSGSPLPPPSPVWLGVKIAFIGAHGVGKTTLCFDVAARLKRLDLAVELVKEVARSCPLPINRDTTLDAQAWILHSQIAEEIAASARYQVVICDRSALDNYAYLVHRVGRQSALDPLVGAWMASYDALFKVPILNPPSFDGTRDTSTGFQAGIDALIDALLGDFRISHHRLDPAHRDGWVEEVLTAVGQPLTPPQIDIFASDP